MDETGDLTSIESSGYAGLKTVSIDRIQGTEDKADEFAAEFHPIRERSRNRWMGIALQRLHGRELPPAELIQVGDIYFVRDGHHRISVSRAMGQAFIEAEVTAVRLRQGTLLRRSLTALVPGRPDHSPVVDHPPHIT